MLDEQVHYEADITTGTGIKRRIDQSARHLWLIAHMYSILPIIVATIFFLYGLYVVCSKGFTRVGASFFVLCIATACWQGTWAVLFQIHDPRIAMVLIKFGYLLILFLPTSLYHFLTDISCRTTERNYVYASYCIVALLAVFLLGTDFFVSGYYEYFWGFYPKAGVLHPLHVLQTIIVVNRGLYITFRQQQIAAPRKRTQLRWCIAAILIYFFAAIDYACNYGAEFYPPGVVFIVVSLGVFTIAIFKHALFDPMTMAASVAHEMRTPLASIRMLATGVDQFLPRLLEGYRLAVQHGLIKPTIRPAVMERLATLGDSIAHEIRHTNTVLDMMLASVRMDALDTNSYARHSIAQIVSEAIDRYPFDGRARDRVSVVSMTDFEFHGSDTLLVLVLFNLMKNALHSVQAAGKGGLRIGTACTSAANVLYFSDTGLGIPAATLPHIFDAFFTTRKNGGSGVGLAFCQRVMHSFGGRFIAIR
jgi:two-component system CAI-1 autoinducer sensor kinase/phosphatase CqsS